jgi:hypothetical protein
MNSTGKIRDFITLLTMNESQLSDELNSLAAKVNNFLDDRKMLLSGQLISVMYTVLTEQNVYETTEPGTENTLDETEPGFEERLLALV